MEPKFDIEVQLSGEDGNAFAILGRIKKALERHEGCSGPQVQQFMDEATEGDYDHLLQTCMKWVNVQ